MDAKAVRQIVEAALEARENAYAPYSGFSVGAALLCEGDEIVTGCNVENASYPAGMCAERTAVFSAVARGKREFRALAVAGGKTGSAPSDHCMPCGMCLQVISEFCPPDFEIYVAKSAEEVQCYRLRDLLPHVFDSLEK